MRAKKKKKKGGSAYADRTTQQHCAEIKGGTILVSCGGSWKEALPDQDAAIRALMPHMARHTGQGSMSTSTIIELGTHRNGYGLQKRGADYCIVGKEKNVRKIVVMPSADLGTGYDVFSKLIHS